MGQAEQEAGLARRLTPIERGKAHHRCFANAGMRVQDVFDLGRTEVLVPADDHALGVVDQEQI